MYEQFQSDKLKKRLSSQQTDSPRQELRRDKLINKDSHYYPWTDDATIFKQQPGFISTQLHRGISGSGTFINYAVWESVAAYKKATSNVGIQTRLSNYPASTVASPHLFEKLAVPDICIEYHINDKYPKLMTRWYKSEM